MNYEALQEDVLSENDLKETIEKFNSTDESVWHINRHPMDVHRDYPNVDHSDVQVGILLGLAMLKAWLQEAATINSFFISRPYLVIENNWLDGVEFSSPPYVYICLAKDESSFEPVTHNEAVDRKIDLDIDMEGLVAKYLEGSDGDSAWLIFGKN